jgi:hypothetical protein
MIGVMAPLIGDAVVRWDWPLHSVVAAMVILDGCAEIPKPGEFASAGPELAAPSPGPTHESKVVRDKARAKLPPLREGPIGKTALLRDSPVGKRLDAQDYILAVGAERELLEMGAGRRDWQNQGNGRHGEVALIRKYQYEDIDCCDYSHTIYIDDREEIVQRSACRKRGSKWRVDG